MRCILAATLLVPLAAADPEPDAAVADAARWVEPRGCASGSFRSHALPVVAEIEEAWHLEFEAIESPPVHWDGTGYLVARAGGKLHLVAFDLATGKELARTFLRAFVAGSGLLVWDHMVLLQPEAQQFTGYVLKGRKLEIAWICRGRQTGSAWVYPRLPVIHDNELFCFLGNDIARFRPGASAPSWTAALDPGIPEGSVARVMDSRMEARPIVCGPFVLVLWYDAATTQAVLAGETKPREFANLMLAVYRRSNGANVLHRKIGSALYEESMGPELQAMIAGGRLLVNSRWPFPAMQSGRSGLATQLMLPVRIDGETVDVGEEPRLWAAQLPPACHPRLGVVMLSREAGLSGGALEWQFYRDGKIYGFARESEQPELFGVRVTPTVLGDVVYFGSWAADVETGEILWRLPTAGAVTYPIVPADRLVLAVERGRILRAFRGRGKQ